MRALQIESFGNAAEVVKAVDIRDVGKPAAGEVVIAVEASPINQNDLLMIVGGYGYRPRLPAIMGTEGVGRIVAVRAGVKHLKEGDRALVPFHQSAKPDEIMAMFDHLAPLIAAGTISAPVAATYGFDQFREAITKAAQSSGKVLFTLSANAR